MKPYKVNNTWVDLDHVVTIEDSPIYDTYRTRGVDGLICVMFREQPITIDLGRWNIRPAKDTISHAQSIWDTFKEAWKNKDKVPNDSNPTFRND